MDFNVIEAIKERRSVRTYEEREVDINLLKKIRDYISRLDNPFGDNSVFIRLLNKRFTSGEKLGTYGVVKGATNFLALLCNSNDEKSVLAAGYQFEQLILYITDLGLGTVWLGATFSQKNFTAALGELDSDPKSRDSSLVAISPVGYPAKKRMLERVMRTVAHSDSRLPWDEIFFCNDFATPLTVTEAGPYAEALEMLRLAPSSTNTQPWRILKVGNQFHFFVTMKEHPSDDTLLLRRLDMGIALSHFNLALQSTSITGTFTTLPSPASTSPSTPSTSPSTTSTSPIPPNFRYLLTFTPTP